LLAKPSPLNINLSSDRFSMFNKERDNASATTKGGSVYLMIRPKESNKITFWVIGAIFVFVIVLMIWRLL
jgi:hypothetical protein